MHPLVQLVLVSAVTMGMSHTIAKERLFAWLRDRLGGKATFCGYLVSCPYCVSHWIAFVLVPVTGTSVLRAELGALSGIVSWFLNALLVTVLAAFLRVVFYWVDEEQGLVRREARKIEQQPR